ncbi:MAG: hypothetical protein ABUL72_05980, partial [Armatimonadota bacterium]
LLPADGILYPYEKSGAIVNCPDGNNLKPGSGGAPFTIDVTNAPLGYDKNQLIVFSQATPTSGVTYGPFPSATSWDDVANSVLLADAGFAPSSASASQSSFNGLLPPKTISNNLPLRCSTANQQARHGDISNIAFQDTHAKGMHLFLPPDRISGGTTWTCRTNTLHTGLLLGPGASATYDANGGSVSVTANANYYFVPDKSSTNPYN